MTQATHSRLQRRNHDLARRYSDRLNRSRAAFASGDSASGLRLWASAVRLSRKQDATMHKIRRERRKRRHRALVL